MSPRKAHPEALRKHHEGPGRVMRHQELSGGKKEVSGSLKGFPVRVIKYKEVLESFKKAPNKFSKRHEKVKNHQEASR